MPSEYTCTALLSALVAGFFETTKEAPDSLGLLRAPPPPPSPSSLDPDPDVLLLIGVIWSCDTLSWLVDLLGFIVLFSTGPELDADDVDDTTGPLIPSLISCF